MGEYADDAIERGFDDHINYENNKDNDEWLIENGFGNYDGFINNPYEE